MTEQSGDTIDDCEPEPQTPLGPLGAFRQSMKLLEHGFLVPLRNADAGVDDLNCDVTATSSTAYEHGALACVAPGIADEILQDTSQQGRVRVGTQVGFCKSQLQSLFLESLGELRLEGPERVSHVKVHAIRFRCRRIEPGDIEQAHLADLQHSTVRFRRGRPACFARSSFHHDAH